MSRVFLVPDEFHLLQYRATIAAVRRRIEAKELPVRDAFIAFNSSKTGALSCSEMYGALEWLGIRVTPSQVQAVSHQSVSHLLTAGALSWSSLLLQQQMLSFSWLLLLNFLFNIYRIVYSYLDHIGYRVFQGEDR